MSTIVQELQERLAASPFHAALGVVVREAEAGAVELSFVVHEGHVNLQGLVHGGLLATFADTAMGLAVRTAVAPGRRHVTIHLGVQYVRPASPGPITARGRVIRVGSQIAHAEADVVAEAGDMLARATGTYSVAIQREP